MARISTLAKLSVVIGADAKQFQSEMNKANKSVRNLSKKMASAGKALTLGLTGPIVALGVAGVRAFDKQAKAVAQVRQGLLSTGNAVGFTTEQLKKQASELQKNSLFGDEEILQGVTAQLLTFTNIAGEQFSKTQQAALDLAARLGTDLKSASIQLGKALNDPVANLSALSRSGIQFSEEQKKVVNSMARTGNLAGAQTVILKELEKQYGGSAAAAAKAGLGPIQQLGNTLGDLSEELGAVLLPIINKFANKIKEFAGRFEGLTDAGKKNVFMFIGLVAAIGPVLLIGAKLVTLFGVIKGVVLGLRGAFILMRTAGLSAVIAPLLPIIAVIAIITALGVIIYTVAKNWELIKLYAKIAFAGIKYGILKFTQFLIQANPFGLIIDGINKVIEGANSLGADIGTIKNPFDDLADSIGSDAQAALNEMEDFQEQADKIPFKFEPLKDIKKIKGKLINKFFPKKEVAADAEETGEEVGKGLKKGVEASLSEAQKEIIKQLKKINQDLRKNLKAIVLKVEIGDLTQAEGEIEKLKAFKDAAVKTATLTSSSKDLELAKIAAERLRSAVQLNEALEEQKTKIQDLRDAAAEYAENLKQSFSDFKIKADFEIGEAAGTSGLEDDLAARKSAIDGLLSKTKELRIEVLKLQELNRTAGEEEVAINTGKIESINGQILKNQELTQAYVEQHELINQNFEAQAAQQEQYNKLNEQLVGITQEVGGAFADNFVSIIDGTKSAGEAFKSFGDSVIQIIIGVIKKLVAAIASAALLNALTGGAAGGIGGALGKVSGGLFGSVPKLASGGLAFGKTLSIVGDNNNASADPEVIAPLSKLKQYIQPQSSGGGAYSFRVEGRDLVAVLDEQNKYNSSNL